MSSVYVYYFDIFKNIDIGIEELFELADKNPLELFNKIRDVIKDLGRIEDVKVYRRFFDPKNFDTVIKYLVRCNIGEVSVKIIYSRNPVETLKRYYEYEHKNT